MDGLIGGGAVLLVVLGGLLWSSRTRVPERLVTPSPLAGWDAVLAAMPKEERSLSADQDLEDLLAGTESAAVSAAALPPLQVDFDLDLDSPASSLPSPDDTPAPRSSPRSDSVG